jgi:(1->4)-alpha-D-glucan 1-alpha-D-glucosylmutase
VASWAVKAAREAKRRTSWVQPDAVYEDGLVCWVEGLLHGPAAERFVPEVDRLVRRVGPAGAANALLMVALAGVSPGVLDLYQGSEGWLLVGVDPDNRRPLDVDGVRRLVAAARDAPVADLAKRWADGAVKTRVTMAVLDLRRRHPQIAASAAVDALTAHDDPEGRVVAVARRWADGACLVVGATGRAELVLPGRLPAGRRWVGDASLAVPRTLPDHWVDLVTGRSHVVRRRRLAVADLLAELPVAVLQAQ